MKKVEDFKRARGKALRKFETEYLISVLRQSKGNLSEAARIAKVDRKHIWRIMQRNGIRIQIGE